jgi:hypothetical protein
MPKLGLGINVANSSASGSAGGQITTLYSDSLIAWPNSGATFRDRQIFSSSGSASVSYGNGIFEQITGASGRHALVYFNCDKQLYPVYNSDDSYVVDDQVYGGSYGHAIFEKIAGGTGAPIFLNPFNPGQDANGWLRVHPTLEPLEIGKSIIVSFDFKALSPGNLSNSSSIRFAILDSSIGGFPYYINADEHGLSNPLFGGDGETPGYRGYMTTLSSGTLGHRIFSRTTTTNDSLVNTINLVWTQRSSIPTSNLSLDVNYSVKLKVTRTGSNTIVYAGEVTGGTLSGGALSYTNNFPDTFVFDTLAVDVIANACASFQISNVEVVRGPSSLV